MQYPIGGVQLLTQTPQPPQSREMEDEIDEIYPFHGGPADGHMLAVFMIETSVGLEPPNMWRLSGGQLDALNAPRHPSEADHNYRFVEAPVGNPGHYEWVRP